MNPKYPIYIISKGRWESRLTSKTLEAMHVPYHIVIEPQEYDDYAAVIDPKKIFTLPFSNLGQGSIPARNWVWEHAISTGAERHWILDDNVQYFYRLNKNKITIVNTGTVFRIVEDFTDRYENVAMSGFNYRYFCPAGQKKAAFYLNTRVYSTILIRNDLPQRWRGKYNEDTDLSLRILKDGWSTILFNAFVSGKITTLTMKGGNTDNVYIDNDERMKFAKSLQDQHPDVVEIVRRYGRWHHLVNYKRFSSNKLIKKQGLAIEKGVDEYGLVLTSEKDELMSFFKTKEIQAKNTPVRRGSPSGVKRTGTSTAKVPTCEDCGLYKNCVSPKMTYTGQGAKKILIVAEAPGAAEDEQNKQLVGQAGKYLQRVLQTADIDIEQDCWKTNAISCKLPKGRAPSVKELNACRGRMFKIIEELKPEKIILLGKTALSAFIGHRTTNIGTVEKWIGHAIPDQLVKAWVFPMWHPSYLLREKNITKDKIFKEHMHKAIGHSKALIDYGDETKKVRVLIDEKEICTELIQLCRSKIGTMSFDYEASGLKPFVQGHKIKCVSIAITESRAIAFPLGSNTVRDLFIKLLQNKRIGKIAHNLKYEDKWTNVILGTPVANWVWDTMIATHILDNRPGICSLKFQTYINFGNIGYGKAIGPYLKGADEKDSNSFNRIDEAPLDELLLYCGMDAMFTYRLAMAQMKVLQPSRAYDLMHEGTLALSQIELNGITVNRAYYQQKQLDLEKQVKRIEKYIQNSPEMSIWKEHESTEFNPGSDAQLRKLLFTHMGLEATDRTATGLGKVDAATLDKLSATVPFVKSITKLSKINKINSTYVKGFLRESPTGRMYPGFGLHTVQTYRSSSSNPNFQNIPKRDKEAQQLTRTGLIPGPGRMLVEVDYKGIEVRISTCYHHDPMMREYIERPGTDMHRDVASDLFIIPPVEITAEQRYLGKNMFVFPQFYGDYFVNCAQNLWAAMDDATKKHLRSKNIGTYETFEKHVGKVEDDFWNRRFKVYSQWKEETLKMYAQKGYIELLTGFVCGGFMQKNDILNYPIQGTAFHCLLWSLIQLNTHLHVHKYESQIIGQIHDAIVLDVVPSEWPKLKALLIKIMCHDIRDHWGWITVPLDISIETSKVDGTWFEMSEI